MNRYQTVPPQQKYTVKQFEAEFPTEDSCLEYVKEKRWPGGKLLCVRCGVERKHYRVRGRTAYTCLACGNFVYPLAGTIFHKSTTSLRTWFYRHPPYGVYARVGSERQADPARNRSHLQNRVAHDEAGTQAHGRLRQALGPVEMDEAHFG